jgi:CheY-like chemotaxis protein
MMQTQDKILVVDDDLYNIAILKELLDDHYDLQISSNGEQAVEIVREFQPDMILLDIMMPGMDGYEVCRRLRENSMLRDTKIIMVSARAMRIEQSNGYHVGADGYITKPFDGDDLLEKVRVHLHAKNAKESDQIKSQISRQRQKPNAKHGKGRAYAKEKNIGCR